MPTDLIDQFLLLFAGILGIGFMGLSVIMYWQMDGRCREEIRYRIKRLIPLGIIFVLLWGFSVFR